jgi:hypothetical protein
MKKTVKYDQSKTIQLAIGVSAIIFPINHPDSANVSNEKHVVTSTVVKISPNGVFETLNTVYVPEALLLN